MSPEEGVKKHDQVHLSPTESLLCSALESPSSSLTLEHSNLQLETELVLNVPPTSEQTGE